MDLFDKALFSVLKLKVLLALLTLACLALLAGPVLAAEQAATVTGLPVVDTILAYLGAIGASLATLATVLPRTWKLTQVLARLSTDVRGILTPDTEDDPEWAQRIRKDSSSLIIFAMFAPGLSFLLFAGLLSMQGCAFFKGTVAPSVVECAPGRQYLIDGLSHILQGDNAFDVLDGIRKDKGAEFVLCTLQHFLDRVTVSPATAVERARARAYLERK